ncbi:hypothetical protein FA04_02990 [Ensifer adhaerens]|uniref:Uncharacterized protein n=1 Tax=Ensifer adhaerens TaxID=106592 RepID=A0ABY8HIK3_ENSAD|nr:hypothetical protein [Ensifer adhaerens]ANK71688.1 hypothetical protein FA04_02990 [Ensifer adhaerens]KDP71586.1 hypothetical protein FA04_22200 [Ensifer adhaerens]WFP91365.1 hypothetical protein P4B07_03015 [Ensifer adhaerens]
MLQAIKTESTEIQDIAALVEAKYGAAKVVPLWAVGNALLHDLAHSGLIPVFTEAVDVEDVHTIQPRLVPVYDEEGLRAGDLFAVVDPENCRVGLSDNGDAIWVDADTVEEALLIYERRGE